MPIDQFQSCPGGLFVSERVKNRPARITPDERSIGEIEAPDLVNVRHDLLEAIVHVEYALALQRRVDVIEFPVFYEELLGRI
ncbi:MAG: hypothetical protein ABFS45_13365 [Pseudomonadota bacterium]